MKRNNIYKALNATITLIAVLLCLGFSGCSNFNKEEAKVKQTAEPQIERFVLLWDALNDPEDRMSPTEVAGEWNGTRFDFEWNGTLGDDKLIGFLGNYKIMIGSFQIAHSFKVNPNTMAKHCNDSVYEIEGTLIRKPLDYPEGSIKDLPVTFRFVYKGSKDYIKIVGIETKGSLNPVITSKGIKETSKNDMPSNRQKVTSWFDTATSWFTTAIYNIKNLHTKVVPGLNLSTKERLKCLFYFFLAMCACIGILCLISWVWMKTIGRIIPDKWSEFIGCIYGIFSVCSFYGAMVYILAPKTVVITTTIYVMAVALVFFFVWTIIDKILQIRREKKAKRLSYR